MAKSRTSWKKYFKTNNLPSNISPMGNGRAADPAFRNYQSQLPEVYTGQPNRVERYNQYEQMSADAEIAQALDILAEFCTQKNQENFTAFQMRFKEQPTDNEVRILKEQLQQWTKLNEFNKRIYKVVYNTFKYGDQVFIRDPETFKLMWVEMSKVTKVIVNEGEGKKPEQYLIKDLNPNFQNLTATSVTTSDTYMNHPQIGGPSGSYTVPQSPFNGGSRFSHAKNEAAIGAEHVVHLSLTEGLDAYWPFGESVLEKVFKVFKQKELLEDSIIIYRIQRAPERRVFKIDVGNMPSHMAMAFVDRVKNEVHQRRIPTQSGGGGCFVMDTQVPLLDGRTLTIGELAGEYTEGKENWAYSCNPVTGDFAPGIITWAGVTQVSAKIIEVVLDNGEVIRCTPEHKFPVVGKGFVEAQYIIPAEDTLFGKDNKHTITEIRRCDLPEQVGTLTIDGNEVYHDFHTFAIAQGVYTKNSVSMMDSTYSPIATNEDFFFPHTSDGRGSSVDVLPGGNNLGEITDLRFFSNKMYRALGIPSSYLPTTADDGTASYSDGRVGTALIQEWRFNQHCMRLQSMIADKLDSEFKLFLKWRGFNIDGSLFDLAFNEPQNFAQYRQADIDSARIATFTQLEGYSYLSKRWLMKRYLGMTEQEISENEVAWAQEKGDAGLSTVEAPGLRSVGISPGGIAGDMEGLGDTGGVESGMNQGGTAGGNEGGSAEDAGQSPAL